jgi:hypothetical protein
MRQLGADTVHSGKLSLSRFASKIRFRSVTLAHKNITANSIDKITRKGRALQEVCRYVAAVRLFDNPYAASKPHLVYGLRQCSTYFYTYFHNLLYQE